MVPGADLGTMFKSVTCQSNIFSGMGSASATAAYNEGTSSSGIHNAAAGTVALGQIHLTASNSAEYSAFPSGDANGGWTERLTVTSAGKDGESGILVALVKVDGTLHAERFAGSASFETVVYEDNNRISGNTFGFSPGTQSDGAGYGLPWNQEAQWSVSTYGASESVTKLVNDTVQFAVPFVFGTPFEMGVYAIAHAGQRSSGYPTTSDTEFSNTLYWAGIGGVYDANHDPVLDYALTGASGIDWTVAAIPEAETWALFLAGLAVVGAISRRRRPI